MAIDKSLLGSHHLVLSSMDKEKKTVDRFYSKLSLLLR